MPKMSDTVFFERNESKEERRLVCDTRVMTDGTFVLRLPEDVGEEAQRLIQTPAFENEGLHASCMSKGMEWVAQGKMLGRVKDLVEQALRNVCACKIEREAVIVYATKARVAYCKDKAGMVYPNGSFVATYDKGGATWGGELDGSMKQDRLYSIHLGARAIWKINYIRPSGTTIKYDFIRSGEIHDEKSRGEVLGPQGKLLNSFVGMRSGMEIPRNGFGEEFHEIPYTEEAAGFFYESMMSMLRLAERLTSFFGDTTQVQFAIENHTSVLALAGPSTETIA